MTEICRPDDRYDMVLCTVTEIDSRYDCLLYRIMDFEPEAFVIHRRSHQGVTAGVVTMC